MTLRGIRMEAQRGLPLSQIEKEALTREGLLPLRPLGSRSESILTATQLSLAPDGDLDAAYVIRHVGSYLGAFLMGRGRTGRRSREARLIMSLFPNHNPVNLVLHPWCVLQYPTALLVAWTELAQVSTSLI